MLLNLYDMRTGDPKVVELGIHEMSPDKEPLVRAMSPGGTQVAYIHTAPAERGFIYVFSTEGKPVAKITVPDVSYEQPIRKLWFAGESRLLAQTDKFLKVYELPTGEEAWTFAGSLDTPLQLTRGRKWLSIFHGDRFAFYSTADGKLAGEIPLPEHWQSNDPILYSAIAFHHDGKRMATFCASPTQDVLVTSWDIASGKPVEQFEMPGRDFKWEKIDYHGSFWSSDRRIVTGTGHVIDFDYHTWICKAPQTYAGGPEHSYDGRCWVAGYPGEENREKLAEKYGPNLDYLFASTVPSKAKEAEFAQYKEKPLLYPGCTIGITCADTVPKEHQAKFITAYADSLATRGVRVDQECPHKIQLHSADVQIVPNPARLLNMPNAPKDRVWMGLVRGQLIRGDGKRLGAFGGSGVVEYEGKKEDTWDAIAGDFAKSTIFPRFMYYYEHPAGGGLVEHPLQEDKLQSDALQR